MPLPIQGSNAIAGKAALEIAGDLLLPYRELSFTFSRSSKPGGQNVNKVNTRVSLVFAVTASPSLTSEQKTRICQFLPTRINKRGQLRVVSYRYRTQGANRTAAVERFVSLLREALAERTPRRATRVSNAAKKRRHATKKRHSLLKQSRTLKTSRHDS